MSHPVTSAELRAELPGLQALARQLCGATDPEDVVQSTIVTALAQPQRPRQLRGWLRQVLRNEVRMRRRASTRRRAREGLVASIDDGAAPQDLIAQLELTAAVLEVLAGLDASHAAVLRARFFEGRSAVELAQREGCAASTIRSRTQRALREMRAALDERYGDRSQWMGGLLPVCGLSLESAAPASTLGVFMAKTAIWKTLTLTLTLVAATALTVYTASRLSRADLPARGSAAATAELDPVQTAPALPQHAEVSATEAKTKTGAETRYTPEQRERWEARRAQINRAHAARFGVEPARLDERGAIDPAKVEAWRQDPKTGEAMVGAVEELMPVYAECLTLAPRPVDAEGKPVALTAKVEVKLIGDPDTGLVVDEPELLDSSIDTPEVRECLLESVYSMEFPNPGIALRESIEFAVDVSNLDDRELEAAPSAPTSR